MFQPSVLKHAIDTDIFVMLKHISTGCYVGYEKFEQSHEDALVKIIRGDELLPSVVSLKNHFIEEVDIDWLRNVAPRELMVVSIIGNVNREPR